MEKILIISLVGVIMCVVLREKTPQLAILLSIVVGILIFSNIIQPLENLISVLNETAQKANVSEGYFSIVLKIIGISYLAQFGSQLCKDAGENAVAIKVELAGKVLIMATSAPVLIAVLEVVLAIV